MSHLPDRRRARRFTTAVDVLPLHRWRLPCRTASQAHELLPLYQRHGSQGPMLATIDHDQTVIDLLFLHGSERFLERYVGIVVRHAAVIGSVVVACRRPWPTVDRLPTADDVERWRRLLAIARPSGIVLRDWLLVAGAGRVSVAERAPGGPGWGRPGPRPPVHTLRR